MKSFLKRQLLPTTGMIAGGIAGFLYWKFSGCTSGSCPITSSPVWSVLYGVFMGGLLLSFFQRGKGV